MTRTIGIDFISVLGLPPVEFVTLAAELGCPQISIAPAPFTANPHQYPLWSLREDATLRRDFAAALRHHNVTISLGEGFLLRPGADIRDAAADMDMMRKLGVPIVNAVCLEPEHARAIDQLGAFAALAQEHGMKATLEMMPFMPLGSLAEAAAAISEVGNENLGLLLDAMHIFRSGATTADIGKLDPKTIFYAQLCDVPLVSKYASYGEEARDNRLPPGKGELPLRDFISALPPHLSLGLEIPMLEAANAGIGPRERLAPAIAATRALMA
jgi:sugar phosphate isomerase/epimerase